MPVIPITLFTAGILGLIYIALTVRVVMARQAANIMTGDGAGRPEADGLLTAIRAHANFAEYVPLILLLLGGIEISGGAHWLLRLLALLLIIGRIAHPVGMARPAPNPYRIAGAALTWLTLVIAALWAVFITL